mmetsp:Transcript_95823/g.219630  ORF Transcript_95823/g.219630 Transcript_95823/m.219630 type:complete len:212 (-) Transcript_95823:201-836(-)
MAVVAISDQLLAILDALKKTLVASLPVSLNLGLATSHPTLIRLAGVRAKAVKGQGLHGPVVGATDAQVHCLLTRVELHRTTSFPDSYRLPSGLLAPIPRQTLWVSGDQGVMVSARRTHANQHDGLNITGRHTTIHPSARVILIQTVVCTLERSLLLITFVDAGGLPSALVLRIFQAGLTEILRWNSAISRIPRSIGMKADSRKLVTDVSWS